MILNGVMLNRPGRVYCLYYGDEDNDGIYDNKDECPNTSNVISVDKWGCLREIWITMAIMP